MRPLALDLFACAGGSTTGLEAAGFDVIGIDHKPSQHWTGSGELHEADLSTADAVEAVVRAFKPDLVSASPPCQANSVATATHARERHANLIASTREGLLRAGVTAWMENVPPIPRVRWPEIVRPDVVLCGSMFAETQRLRRHRHFELLGWFVFSPAHVNCTFAPVSVAGHGPPDAAQSARYRERRDTVTVCDNANSVRGANRGSGWAKEKQRRELVTVAGESPWGTTPGGAANARRKRQCVGVFVFGLEGPGQEYGQNRPGPECIRWREALGWIDGPKHRYSLAQAVPPAYAKWLGERFLETRSR